MRSGKLLDSPPRIVAIDYGTRRVGIAIADPLWRFAQPLGVFTQESAAKKLVALHAIEGLRMVVVGWPLLEEGGEGIATARVQQYINRLRRLLPGVPMQKWDERYTTEEAKSRLALRQQPITRGQIDVMAAGIILQEYLDDLLEGMPSTAF